jgi:hypothetical protein
MPKRQPGTNSRHDAVNGLELRRKLRQSMCPVVCGRNARPKAKEICRLLDQSLRLVGSARHKQMQEATVGVALGAFRSVCQRLFCTSL